VALKRAKKLWLKDFWGLNTTTDPKMVDPHFWITAENVVVTQDGSAGVLRSPKTWNDATATVNSAIDYNKDTGRMVVFSYNGGTDIASTTGTANTAIAASLTAGKMKFLNVDNRIYILHGAHTTFFQTDGTSSNFLAVGIVGPAAAPTISYVAGGSGAITTSINISYAYRNSATGHISNPSPVSNTLTASAGNLTIRTAVTASAVSGVDGIVFFATVDGGSIRYLRVDSNGDMVVASNTTGNVDVSIASLFRNTQITEPVSNYHPNVSFKDSAGNPSYPYFAFKWKNRILVCDFRDDIDRPKIQYSAFETVQLGKPWHSWPPQNAIFTPGKGDAAVGGIETPSGALIMGEEDSYMIRGTLTDKVATFTGDLSLSESVQPMGWSIGTRSPHTIAMTPFGPIWLDQNKRIQMWTYEGFPSEAGLPIRTALSSAIGDTTAIRRSIDATWYQHGKDGGVYVLTVPDAATMFAISVYRNPEDNQLRFACSKFTMEGKCVFVAQVSGRSRFFFGGASRIYETLDLDTEGSGWGSETRHFKHTIGVDDEFAYFHSVRFDATDTTGLTVSVQDSEGGNSANLTVVSNGGSNYAIIDRYGYRFTLSFSFSTSDTTKKIINNIRVTYKNTGREI
jgi:hypothetical protein